MRITHVRWMKRRYHEGRSRNGRDDERRRRQPKEGAYCSSSSACIMLEGADGRTFSVRRIILVALGVSRRQRATLLLKQCWQQRQRAQNTVEHCTEVMLMATARGSVLWSTKRML